MQEINSHKTIYQLVDDNYVHAQVLYYFGVNFYEHYEDSLATVCHLYGLDMERVIEKLDTFGTSSFQERLALDQYPVDLVIEYLKHAHYLYIKENLPYLRNLVQGLDPALFQNKQLITDLQLIFPEFVKDFIGHMYEEEDHLFSYVLKLSQATKGKYQLNKVYFDMQQHCIQEHALEHSMEDDEMLWLRKLTTDYTSHESSLHLQVVYKELEAFEKDLSNHARIENEILFPKAIMLEQEVSKMIQSKVALN